MRRFFAPEILFLLGTLQAVFPYLFWVGEGSSLNYIFEMTWGPGIIYLIGLFSFLIGARLAGRIQVKSEHRFFYLDSLRSGKLFLVNVTLCGLLVVQIVQLTRVYGTIPLLAFISGDLDINDANESLEGSALGQMALLQLTLLMLNAIVTLIILKRLRNHSFRPFSLDLLLPAALLVVGFTMGGKRQGLFMAIFFAFTALVLHGSELVNRLLAKLMIRGWAMRTGVYVCAPLIALCFFQFLGMARSGRSATLGLRESFFYLELPLINLEYQYELIGLGPDTFAPQGLLKSLVPRRIQENLIGDGATFDWPLKLEPTASAGFYGDLHWHTGLLGICLFTCFAGWISRFCYERAQTSLAALLCYCQIVWTLLSCHSYNHFLNLVFIPLPAICYILLATVIRLKFGSKNVKFQKTAKIQSAVQFQSSRS